MGEWNIYDSNGQVKAIVKKLEYNGEFMGERSITATLYSPSPINLAVGDYLTYRNEVFSIDYDPSILKQARNNTYGQGYVYDSVKFNSRQMELVYCKFLDYVIADNQVHYSSLPNFSFYCETITNLTERIQANLNRLYTGGKAWTITVNTQNVHVGRINIDVQGMTCWDALGLIASKFESTFVIRGRNIVVAPSTDILTGLFQYGKGNGLRSIARTSDPSQGVVTRLRAMGNTTNMPYNYYRNKDMYVYAPITEVLGPYETSADIHTTFDFNNCFTVKAGTSADNQYRTKVSLDKTNWAPAIFSANAAWVGYSVASVMQLPGYDPTQYAAFMQQLNTGTYTKLYFESGISKDKWPSSYKEYTGTLGVTTGEDRLMLPTYPDVTTDPYIDSANISKYGIREESVIFDGSNGLDDIFPTIQGMTAEQARAAGATISLDSGDNGHLDEIVSATQIDDDGIPPVEGEESEMVETFSITLKDIGFNINDYFATDNAVISMRDGKCEGREFEITECVKSGNKYVLTCKRELDDSLNRYYPYDDYNLTAGDKFVLLQIEMPELYVDAASQRLEDAAEAYLATIDHSIYTIEPKIDNIKAKRHDDEIESAGEGVKVYDTIYEGMLMQIEDEDLDIDDAIFIDRLTIKEGESLIPQYEVVLRNEKVKSSIQQIQQQLTDIKSGVAGVPGTGSVDANQVNQLIKNYGDNRFLRKDIIDKLKQGVQVGDRFVSGLLGEGGIFRRNADDGTTYIEADSLYIRMKAYFDTLEVRKLQYSSGNRVASAAGIKAIKVEKVGMYNNNPVVLDDDGYYHYTDGQGHEQSVQLTVTAYRCYFRMEDSDGNPIDNDFVAGDLARSQEFNLQSGLRGYWRKVIRTNGQTPDEDGLGWIDLSNVSGEYLSGSGEPTAQDDIVQLGNVNDTGRQGAIIEYSTGAGNVPSYQIYQGINSFSLENKNKIDLGYNPSTGRAYLNVYGDFFFGNNAQSGGQYTGSYIKYNAATGALEIKGTISAKSPIAGTNVDLEQYIRDMAASGGWTEAQIRSLVVDETSSEFADIDTAIQTLQNQVDGAIETWYYSGTPTLSNAPANSWTTDADKNNHIGDLYYDKDNGYAYRFLLDETNNVYQWVRISDTDITTALANAAAAQDTADSKRKVFVRQPQNSDEYDEGDFWVNATYPATGTKTYENDILRAVTHKDAGVAFNINHWTKASKYTDDSALTAFINGTYATFVSQIQGQVDGKAETWYQSTDPSANWNATQKQEHIGDIWHNTSNSTIGGVESGQDAIWSGSAWQVSAVPQSVYDKIDGKADIFVSKPTTYNVNDMWIIESGLSSTDMPSGCVAGDIVISSASRTNSYTKADWTKKDRYTDDSALTTFINGTYATFTQNIQTQVDGKAETWYQATDPSSAWTTTALKNEHIGDIWHNSSNSTVSGVEAGEDAIWDGTAWVVGAVPSAVYDKINGKASIYVNTVANPPSNYRKNDLWILPAAATINSVSYIKGEVLTATTTSSTYSASHWVKKVAYTNDANLNAFIAQILNNTGASGNAATAGSALYAIKHALTEGETYTSGGLVLSNVIYLGTGSVSSSTFTPWSGINGVYKSAETGTDWKGHGIAAWYGGAMVDHEVSTSASNYAKSLFRFDGSGYLAGGNITWNAQGAVTIKNITTLSDSQNSNLLNELATFNSAFSFATSGQGSTTALSITPNVPFTSLSVLVDNTAKTVITQDANGAAKRIPYYSGATTTTTITNLEALYEDNSLSKKRFGLYIHGTTYGNTAEDLISGERGVMSFGDGGPQIVMGSAGQHIALLATDHDYAGGGASLHLVSDQERVVFTTQEITAKTRLSIGVNKPNTSYPLYVNGNAFVSRLYLASNVYLEYDSTNLGVHLVGAGLYSDSYISALGQSSGSGGGSGGGSSTLAGLTDVSINNATSGQVLAWNGSKWINTTFSGGGADMSAINAALSNYLPLSGGTMTGSLIFGATSKGISAKDGGGRTYIALRDNGSNLWIGAGASQSVHHTGATVISAGWGTYQTTANTTIKIAVPKMSGSTETSTNYDVLHVGNTTSLLIGLLGNGTSDFTDGTEIFSSYAADTGFATENYTDKIYKRSALKMWNYIKGKIGTDTTLTVAKANQLATARTLWGQSFNGTANVSGNMTGVGSISATGDITVTKSNAKISVSGTNGEVGLNSDNNRGVWDYTGSKWLIATNGTNSWLNFGNVGIGTTSPTTKLDVDGAVKATNFSADGSGVAPFYSSTTTLCTNVNADLLDGWHKDNILPLGHIYSSTASLSSYWCKVWSLDMSALQNSDRDATFLVQHGNRGQRGIIHVNVRQTSTAGGGSYTFPSSSNYVSLVSGNIPLDKVRLYQNTSTGICELWLDGNARYGGYSVTMLKKSQLNTNELTSLGTMYSTTFTSAQTLPSGSSVSYTTMSASEQVVGAITANDNITVNKQNGKVSVVGNNGEIGLNSATNRGVWDYTSGAWLIGTNGTNTFLSRGNVGIGTTSPSYKLHVSGSIYATGDVTALSDIRHKNVVSEVNAMVEDISKLPVFYFKWKNCRGDDNLHIGTSAQAVQKLFPELVLGGEELSVNYGVLGTTLGILNSRKLINHEERIKFLEDYNKLLIEDNKALKERIKALEDAA